jgi:creatinine amidohydrolase
MAHAGYWADLTSPELAGLERGRVVAVLPVGATEQHGAHLAMSVDTDLPQAVIARALAMVGPELSALVLPPLAYGKSTEHEHVPGTLSLSAATLLAILDDLGASVARAGVRKFLMFNGHGGNRAVLEIAARDLRARHGLITAHCAWDDLVDTAPIVGADEARGGLHAGDVETSAMLAARPDRVRPHLARPGASAHVGWERAYRHLGLSGGRARPGWLMHDLSAGGVSGDPSLASADKGTRLIEGSARGLAGLLAELDRFEPGEGAA